MDPVRCRPTRAISGKTRSASRLLPVVLAMGCQQPLDVPVPPDLTALAAEYDSPSARLEDETVTIALAELEERLHLLDTLGGLLGIVSTVKELSGDGPEDAGTGVILDRLPIDANAIVRLQGECGNAPDDSGAFGVFDAQLVIRERMLHPVVWGQVHDCVAERSVRSTRAVAEFDGEFAAYSPRLRRLRRELVQEDILVTFRITRLVVNGIDVGAVHGDFRLRQGRTEFLLDLGSVGTVLVVVRGGRTVEVRGADETRVCELDSRECGLRGAQ